MNDIDDIINRVLRIEINNESNINNNDNQDTGSLVVNSNLNNSENMPNIPVMNWDLLKSRISNIKPYDGNNHTLNKFLIRCEDLINDYNQFNDAQLSKHIFQSIQEKLIDKAEILVGNRAELTDWTKLKDALIQCFADRRDIDCLVQELTRMRPFKNEQLINFGSRIQLLRSSIAQKISSNPNLNNAEKVCQINHYDKTALSSFIAGCSGTLRNNLHLKKPASLEDAIGYLNEYENFEKLYGNFNDHNNKATTSKFNRQTYPQPQHYPQNQLQPIYQQPHYLFEPKFHNNPNAFNNNKPTNQFPSQPINIQPRQMPPRRYPTNRQVFGPPQNVFRPNQTPINQLPKPTPMSTTSRNPTMLSQRQKWQNYNNYNQNQSFQNYGQKPNFVSEELFTNEYDPSDQCPENPFYYQNFGEKYGAYNTDDNNVDSDVNQLSYFENENCLDNQTENFPETGLQQEEP